MSLPKPSCRDPALTTLRLTPTELAKALRSEGGRVLTVTYNGYEWVIRIELNAGEESHPRFRAPS